MQADSRESIKRLVERSRTRKTSSDVELCFSLIERGYSFASVRKWFVEELCILAVLRTRDVKTAAKLLGIAPTHLYAHLRNRLKSTMR